MSASATAATCSETSPLLRERSKSVSVVFGSTPPPTCHDLSRSLDGLDLSLPDPVQTLASLRVVLLSFLTQLESALADLDSPIVELENAVVVAAGLKVDDARQWARDGLQLLADARADVVSRLPDLNTAVDRLPDLSLSRLDDVRARLSDLDLPRWHPADCVPALSARLRSLHAHIAAEQPAWPRAAFNFELESFHPAQFLADVCDRLSSLDVRLKADVGRAEQTISKAARDVATAVQQSLHGTRLIAYEHLPEEWRNSPFITHGYRFIPLNRWHLLALSVFALHNETLNIHTHLIPFLLWARALIPSPASSTAFDPILFFFTFFALLCLGASAAWHTMAGCAHRAGMVLSAKLDYVGIGWLIAASVASVVWHAFASPPFLTYRPIYVGASVLSGLAGSVLSFCDWFNTPAHKLTRVAFFVSLALTAVAPLTHLAFLTSLSTMLAFIRPVMPSLLAYLAGLFFYVSHFPERYLAALPVVPPKRDTIDLPKRANANLRKRIGAADPPERHATPELERSTPVQDEPDASTQHGNNGVHPPVRWTAYFLYCANSHVIWHACIVLAIACHRHALSILARGLPAM